MRVDAIMPRSSRHLHVTCVGLPMFDCTLAGALARLSRMLEQGAEAREAGARHRPDGLGLAGYSSRFFRMSERGAAQGAEAALRALARRFGAALPGTLPRLWEAMAAPLALGAPPGADTQVHPLDASACACPSVARLHVTMTWYQAVRLRLLVEIQLCGRDEGVSVARVRAEVGHPKPPHPLTKPRRPWL